MECYSVSEVSCNILSLLLTNRWSLVVRESSIKIIFINLRYKRGLMKETKDNEQKDGFITGKETSCILSELIELIDSTKLYDKKRRYKSKKGGRNTLRR